MVRAIGVFVTLICTLTTSTFAQETTAEELLDSSIKYHDPNGTWLVPHELQLEETRPNGTVRHTSVVLDQSTAGMTLKRRSTEGTSMTQIELEVRADLVEAKLNGSSDISEEDLEKHRLTPERALSTRNYYAYLYGLPMKLKDPGTRLGASVKEKAFQGQDALEIRVTYDEKVGGDIWYFYFHPDNHALIGYRFYHDESKNDGEYITLTDEVTSPDGLRLPKIRKWYTHQKDEFLGTDTLTRLSPTR